MLFRSLTFTKIINENKLITTKKVLKRKYNIQRIDGLEESKVTPPESVYKRIKKENNAIGGRLVYGHFLQNYNIPNIDFSVVRTGEDDARQDWGPGKNKLSWV